MNTSNASTLKSPIAMPTYSAGKASVGSPNWLVRVGRVVLDAMIKNGEHRARMALRSRNFY
jgi:hypothetical protein